MAYQSEIEKLQRRFAEKPEQWFAALADAFRKNGDVDRALEILHIWIEQRPNYTSGHLVHARCLLDREQHAAAAAAFERVLDIDAENIIAIKSLSDIAAREGNENAARHWLVRLLEVDPMNDEAQSALDALAGGAAGAGAAAGAAEAGGAVQPEPAVTEGPSEFEPTVAEQPPAPAAAPATPAAGEGEVGGELVIERAEDVADLEATVETEPIELEQPAEAQETLEHEATVEHAGAVEDAPPTAPSAPEAPPTGMPGGDLEITAFDDELSWDAGERTSHSVTQRDIERAHELHEESLGAAVEPLLDSEETEELEVEVAGAGEAGEEAAVEPTAEPPEFGTSTSEPAEFAGAEPAEAAATAEPTPALEAHDETAAPAPAPAPAAGQGPGEEEEDLPLILPPEEEVAPTQEPVAAHEPEPVVTETMAELYAKQGLYTEAREIYQKLLAQRPGDATMEARIRDLEERAATAGTGTAASPAARYSVAGTGGESVRDFLRNIVATRPAAAAGGGEGAEGAVGAGGAETPLESAFAEPEPETAPREAVSLGDVFGDEPSPPPAAPTAPSPPVGFDEFFGAESQPPADESKSEEASEGDDEGTDEDFQDWLKSLKT